MCLQGLPPQSHRGLHVPDNKEEEGSRPGGAVQVLKTGFQRRQMCDKQRRQRGGNRTRCIEKKNKQTPKQITTATPRPHNKTGYR